MHTSAHEEDMQIGEVGQRGIGRKLEKKCEPLSLLNKQRFLTPAIKITNVRNIPCYFQLYRILIFVFLLLRNFARAI